MIAKQIEPPVSGALSFSVTYSGEGALEEVVRLVDSVECRWSHDLLTVTCLDHGSVTRGDQRVDLLLENDQLDRLVEFLAAISHLREPETGASDA